MNDNYGWACPRCQHTFAPWVVSCPHCAEKAYGQRVPGTEKCLVCGGYHGSGMQCPRFTVTSEAKP